MAVLKYVFVAAYVVFILVVGLRSRKESAGGGDSYLLGGRSIGPVITSFSFAATYISGVCMVNAGKIGWDWGIGAMWNAWGNVLLSIVFMWFFLGTRSRSMSEKLNVQTLPDFLRARYQTEFFKLVGSIVMFIFMIPYTAAVFSSLSYMFTRVFNLPYLPVDDEGMLAKAWSGGKDGMGPLPELLAQSPDHLSDGGRIVVVVSSLMDQAALSELLKGYKVKEKGRLPLFFEKLSVLEIIP